MATQFMTSFDGRSPLRGVRCRFAFYANDDGVELVRGTLAANAELIDYVRQHFYPGSVQIHDKWNSESFYVDFIDHAGFDVLTYSRSITQFKLRWC